MIHSDLQCIVVTPQNIVRYNIAVKTANFKIYGIVPNVFTVVCMQVATSTICNFRFQLKIFSNHKMRMIVFFR